MDDNEIYVAVLYRTRNPLFALAPFNQPFITGCREARPIYPSTVCPFIFENSRTRRTRVKERGVTAWSVKPRVIDQA